MKVGFLAPEAEFSNAILDGLRQRLIEDTLIQWHPGSAPPDRDIEVLLVLGLVSRSLMEALPNLTFIQVLSDGYEGVDMDAATELGIRVSNSPGDIT